MKNLDLRSMTKKTIIEESRNQARRRGLALAGLTACAAIMTSSAHAAVSVKLGWNQELDPGVAGYAVYSGTSSGNYNARTDVGTNVTAVFNSLQSGSTNYYVVTAYNKAGVESSPSSELRVLAPGVLKMTPPATKGGLPQLSFPVLPGHYYEIQACTNLATTNWTTILQTPTAVSNVWTSVTDTDSHLYARRYYRLVLH